MTKVIKRGEGQIGQRPAGQCPLAAEGLAQWTDLGWGGTKCVFLSLYSIMLLYLKECNNMQEILGSQMFTVCVA